MSSARTVCLMTAIVLAGCAAKEVDGPTSVRRTFEDATGHDYYIELTRREGAIQRVLVHKPPAPVATVILFMGGDGRAYVSPGVTRSTNFLIRSRSLFFDHNLMVAVVDVPSDRITLESFRHSDAHAIDMKGVIAELRKLADVPVWAVGTSNGSASAANIAARLPPPTGPDGIVLTASVERSGRGNSVFAAALGSIRVPALVVHHKEDACEWTPYWGAVRLHRALSRSVATDLISIEGGAAPYGDPCEPYHYHGFIGRESEVVKLIADWIKAHPRAR